MSVLGGKALPLPWTDGVSVMTLRKDKPGGCIAVSCQSICFLDEKNGTFEVVRNISPATKPSERRFNDSGVGPTSRFWLAQIYMY